MIRPRVACRKSAYLIFTPRRTVPDRRGAANRKPAHEPKSRQPSGAPSSRSQNSYLRCDILPTLRRAWSHWDGSNADQHRKAGIHIGARRSSGDVAPRGARATAEDAARWLLGHAAARGAALCGLREAHSRARLSAGTKYHVDNKHEPNCSLTVSTLG
jgi:hypothetical protein